MSTAYRRRKKNLSHFNRMINGLGSFSKAETNESEKMARLVMKDAPESFQAYRNNEKIKTGTSTEQPDGGGATTPPEPGDQENERAALHNSQHDATPST